MGTFHRRKLLVTGAGAALAGRFARTAAQLTAEFAYPVALPGHVPGDGFVVRHGYAVENTWYNPGWWHTGEDWYRIEGNTAGVGVHAVAPGDVVFAGSDYPGPVVIVQHAPDLFSVYGHLAFDLAVAAGERLGGGQILGTVLDRTDGRASSHVHFELRTFLTSPDVNGETPRYGYGCGYQCPPGPGYWPIDAPEHPSALGWRNPTHLIGPRAFGPNGPATGSEVVVAESAPPTVDVWTAPLGEEAAEPFASLPLVGGERHAVLAVDAGAPAGEGTSAEAYRLWYRIALPNGDEGWVQAAVAANDETGSDGRPSTVKFVLLPAFPAAD